MKKLIALALMAFALVASSRPARAETFTGALSALNEVPVNASAGTGSVQVTLDTTLNQLQVDVSFSGLLAPVTVAHIHCCAGPGVNAGVATMLPTFVGFPAGVTSGTYSMVFDTSLAATFNPAFVVANGGTPAGAEAALFSGLNTDMAYFNIHTTMFPGGEIRANLMRVLPLGADCTSSLQCESTFCANGVCCNTACTGALDRCDVPTPGSCSHTAPAPTLTRRALVGAVVLLSAVAAVSLRRRRSARTARSARR